MNDNLGCICMALFVSGLFVISLVVEVAKAIAWIRWAFV